MSKVSLKMAGLNGATTLSIVIVRITTLSRVTLSITA